MKQHPNAQDRMTPFMSKLVTGDVTVDTPNGVMNGNPNDLGPLSTGPNHIRDYGARSGSSKTVTVIE